MDIVQLWRNKPFRTCRIFKCGPFLFGHNSASFPTPISLRRHALNPSDGTFTNHLDLPPLHQSSLHVAPPLHKSIYPHRFIPPQPIPSFNGPPTFNSCRPLNLFRLSRCCRSSHQTRPPINPTTGPPSPCPSVSASSIDRRLRLFGTSRTLFDHSSESHSPFLSIPGLIFLHVAPDRQPLLAFCSLPVSRLNHILPLPLPSYVFHISPGRLSIRPHVGPAAPVADPDLAGMAALSQTGSPVLGSRHPFDSHETPIL